MGRYGIIENDSLLETELNIGILTNTAYLNDYAYAFANSLKNLGIRTSIFNSYKDITNEDIVIAIGPFLFKNQLNNKKKNTLHVAVCAEEYPSKNLGYLNRGITMLLNEKSVIKDYDLIFCWYREQVKILSKYHKNVQFLPYAFPDLNDINTENHIAEEDKQYDLFFAGDIISSLRRKKLFEYLSSKYKFYPDPVHITRENKFKVMKLSKICLNLHQDWGLVTEWPRLYEFAYNGCFILSEPMLETEPFERGKDYDTFFWSNMIDKIDFYLNNPDIRKKMSESAYETARKIRMDDAAEVLLERIFAELYYKKYGKNYFNRLRNLITDKSSFRDKAKIIIDRLKSGM